MTGLGLDGIRDELGKTDIRPIPVNQLIEVLGPLDVLRLRDLAAYLVHPPKIAHGLVKLLRSQGARRCRFCGQACIREGGCSAVLCEGCGLIFNWAKALAV